MSTRVRLASNAAQLASASAENEESERENEATEDESTVTTQGWSLAGKSRKSRYVCKGGQKVCGMKITGKEDSIMCDACKDWFHPKCQGLSVDAFRALTKYDFIWLCVVCKPKFMAILEIGKTLETRIEKAENKILESLWETKTTDQFHVQLKDKIQQMEQSVSEIKEQQRKIETSMKEQKEAVQAVPRCTEELKNSAHEIKRYVESQDKDDRDSNIILHNIPESTAQDPTVRKQHDTEIFQSVVAALLGHETKVETTHIFRMGKKQITQGQDPAPTTSQKPRLMMIKLKDRDYVNKLMKRRTHLKEAGYPNVYITKDMSPEERAIQRQLREELRNKGKETHRIFRGKVVPRN